MSNSTTTVKIPASITHDHAYAYGWLTSMVRTIESMTKYADRNNEVHMDCLIEYIQKCGQEARELDAELSRRADERIAKVANA